MTTIRKRSTGHTYIIWLTSSITLVSALLILVLAIVTYVKVVPDIAKYEAASDQAEQAIAQIQIASSEQAFGTTILPAEGFKMIDTFFNHQFKSTILSLKSTRQIMNFLMGALVLTLILLLAQTFLWNRDRKKLELWRESGFLCERLEFLPANRLRLNNIEIELNKTQIDNLLKIAKSRKKGKPIHTLDIGDHGAQSTNRLREELGKKFIEKSFIKHRKQEGYWLEVDSDRIYFQPEG